MRLYAITSALISTTLLATASADHVVCQTTEGSPNAADCQKAWERVTDDLETKGNVDKCFSTNSKGSGCKGVAKEGTCQIVACRKSGMLDLKIWRPPVRSAAERLNETCMWNGLVGGYYYYDSWGKTNDGECNPEEGKPGGDFSINIQFEKV